MNQTELIESLQAMFSQWLIDRGVEPLEGEASSWTVDHQREWTRFKAALDQALAAMDQVAGN